MNAKTYQRRTFQIEAVKVTATNVAKLAEWCGGRVRIETSGPDGGLGEPFIEVTIGRVQGRTQKSYAYIGDWVTRMAKDNSFHVYKDKTFRETFEAMR